MAFAKGSFDKNSRKARVEQRWGNFIPDTVACRACPFDPLSRPSPLVDRRKNEIISVFAADEIVRTIANANDGYLSVPLEIVGLLYLLFIITSIDVAQKTKELFVHLTRCFDVCRIVVFFEFSGNTFTSSKKKEGRWRRNQSATSYNKFLRKR